MFFDRFHFVDPGALVDRDLELVAPDLSLLDEVLASITHPLTQLEAPLDAQVTREQVLGFLSGAPRGREPASTASGKVPQYHFWMRIRDPFWQQPGMPSIRMVGGIGFRVGWTPSVELYYGHMGYHVYPAARGHGYARRACRLLFPLARRHGFKSLWLTCNPDNIASRRTCEHLGARFVDMVPVPTDNPLHARGESVKCRYWLDLR